jgi:hypothetical protein
VRIDFTYKHCRVKLYLKEGCALRIEMVVNDPGDLDILKGLAHLEPPRAEEARAGEARRSQQAQPGRGQGACRERCYL